MTFGAMTCIVPAAAAVEVLLLWPAPGHGRVPFRDGIRAGFRVGFRAPRAVLVGAALLLPAALVLAGSRSVPLAVAVTAGTAVAIVAQRRRADRNRAAALRDIVAELCRACAAELNAGRPSDLALHAALEPLLSADPDAPAKSPRQQAAESLRPVLDATASGGDVVAALRRCARTSGGGALVRVAACWEVASSTGAGLAGAVDRVAGGVAAEEALRRDVAAELAGPRATARLLGGLPLVGVLLGTGLGVDPVAVLLGTPLGLTCLSSGLLLTLLGAWWTSRLAANAEPP